ncbi:MAG: TerD family protein [Magnetococcales bacterium]|nr:TerD family protein [Magnetococcales bacterium]NGZ26507.1 TerD family protein [Magnetococcales bacterium]
MPVILTKGQKISLAKESGKTLTRVVMGLGWDAKSQKGLFSFLGGGGEIDLDASCLLFNDQGQLADAVWFQQLRSKDGSIQHTGDNVSGQGEGDDEQIVVDLSRVPANIKSLVFVVNSFSGESFEGVNNAFCRLVDQSNNQEVAGFRLNDCRGNHTAMVMAKLYRHENDWKMHAIGDTGRGKTFHDLIPTIVANL